MGVSDRAQRLGSLAIILCLGAAVRTTTAFLSNDYSGYFVARNALAFQCVKDGFFRDPYNCSLFYRCADLTGDQRRFQLFQFGCPPGTVYDETNSVCNHPQSVSSCSGIGGQMVIREKEGVAGSGGHVAKPVPGSRPTPLPVIKEVPGTNIPRPVLPSVPTSVANERCQKPGLFRSPEDCRRFYICVDVFGNGTTYQLCEYPCPHGSIFSNRLSLCTEPHLAEPCADNQVSPTTTTTVAPKPPTGGNVVPPTIRPPTIGPPDSFVCAASGYFRHPTNCSRYFQCVNLTEDNRVFQRYEFICSLGTAFHESISQCDHPYNVPGCGGATVVVTPPKPTTGTTTTSSPSLTASTARPVTTAPPAPTRAPPTTPSSSSSQRPPVVPVTPPEPLVGPPCTSEGFLPHPTNCSRFFRCVNASSALRPNHYVKFEFACAQGTAFDISINACNHPDVVPSCGGAPFGSGTTLPSSVSSSTTLLPQPELSTVTPSSIATQPTTTVTAPSTATAGPSSTLQPITVPTIGSTTIHIVTGLPTVTPLPLIPGGGIVPNPVIAGSECQKDGFFRSQQNCSNFFRCVDILGNGQRFHRYDFMCGGGSVFDEAILACNHPSAVPGCGGSFVEVSTQRPAPPSPSSEPPVASFTQIPIRPVATLPPVTLSSTTLAPATLAPATLAPATLAPATLAPATLAPATLAPATLAPTTLAPTTLAPTTTPVTQPPLPSTTGVAPSTVRPTVRPIILPGPPCTQVGFFPHPLECAYFFRCINLTENHSSFQKVEFACGEGTVFDVSVGICNHPAYVPGCEHYTTIAPVPPTGVTSPSGPITQGSTIESITTLSPLITTWPAFITSTVTSPLITSQASVTQSPITFPSSTTQAPTTQTPVTSPTSIAPAPTTQFPLTQSPITVPASTTQSPLTQSPVTVPASTVQSPTTTSAPTTQSPVSSTVQPLTTTSSTLPPSGPACSEAGFFRSPSNCSLFYRCVNTTIQGPPFNRYEFNCGLGSVFDTSINVCNHPQHVSGCEGYVSLPPSVVPGGGSITTPAELPISSSTISSGTTSPASPTTSPTTPIAISSSTTASPVPEPVTGANVGSSSTVVVPVITSTLPPGNLVTVVVPSPPSGGGEGERPCTADGFFRNPQDCARFSRCVLNNSTNTFVKYDFVCGSGSVFDVNIMVCNHPSFVPGCELYVPTSTTAPPCNQTTVTGESGSATTTTSTSTPSSTTTQFTQSSSTQSAITTTTSTEAPAITTVTSTVAVNPPDGATTPAATLAPPQSLVTLTSTQIVTGAATPTTQSPFPSSSTTTRRSPTIISPCVVEGFFIHPTNCSRFFRCVDLTGNATRFQKINFNCPPGTAFDESIHVCNHAHLTSCIVGGTMAPSTPASVGTTSTTAPVVTSSERVEISTSSVPSTTAPSTLPPSLPSTTAPSTQPPSVPSTTAPSTLPPSVPTTQAPVTVAVTSQPPAPSSIATQPSTTSTAAPTIASSTPTPPPVEISTASSTTTVISLIPATSATTTRRPPIGEICLAEGKFTDPTDCSKFYLCQDLLGDGSSFHMCEVECPDDTYFSPALGFCSDRVLPNSCVEGQIEVEHPTVEGALPFNHYLHLLNTRARSLSQS